MPVERSPATRRSHPSVIDRALSRGFASVRWVEFTDSASQIDIRHGHCIRTRIMRFPPSSAPTTTPDGRAPRIREARPLVYLVDDDEATLALLRDLADEAGWEAHGYRRIEPLRSALGRRTPDLLVLDDELPDGRGGDFARELRADPALAAVPMLVCTAAHPMRRAEIGAWAPVVSKPFDLETIERFLARPGGHAPRAGARDQAAG